MNSKRLTKHTPDGACLIINADNEQDARQELKEKFKESCNKLAELEDKLENGTLIDLPCKVGDTVYSYCERFNCVLAYEVEDIHIDKEQTSYFATAFDYSPSCFGEYLDEINFTDEQFHKTVFLTREEAEKALKES